MLAQIEFCWFFVGWQARGINYQVGWGEFFLAGPEAWLIVDGVNSGGAFLNFVGVEDFVELGADFIGFEGEGAVGAGGVFFEALPVALVGERDAACYSQGGEKAPAT